MDTVQNGRLL